jgi:LysR family transcriptional regulator, low CO2-responsive transcriptional regulator
MSDNFNLYPLHVFLQVARLGSVTQAARKLYISQPAVSSHLRALEENYGTPLFERSPRGMQLTEAGQVMLDYANRLFALHDEIPSAVNAARQVVRGDVVVAASSTPGAFLAPQLLSRFQQRYPEAKATLMVGDTAEVVVWLLDYRVPIGMIGETSEIESLSQVQIGCDELRLVARAGDPLCRIRRVESKHLKGRTLLLRESGSSTRAGAESLLGSLMKSFAGVMEVRNTEAIKQMVSEGLGLSVLSSWATQLEEKSGLLEPVRDPRLRHKRQFYLARRKDRSLGGISKALWDCLIGCES